MCVGFIISFGIRCNVGVATVKMTSMDEDTGVPEFSWDEIQLRKIRLQNQLEKPPEFGLRFKYVTVSKWDLKRFFKPKLKLRFF